jgi:hypothetical protein
MCVCLLFCLLCIFQFFYLKLAPKGISCVVVEKGTPGLSFGKKENKVTFFFLVYLFIYFNYFIL